LSDRTFGKPKERHEVEAGPYQQMTDDELRQRIVQLQEELGLPPHTDQNDGPKPN
jgi:hypothetical protein